MNMKYPYENKRNPILSFSDMSRCNLRADCENCFGFCCVALYFSASEGFPEDKDAGKPCLSLQSDFRCSVHKDLKKLGLKGCIAYDCFGAGQKVAKVTYGGHDWRQAPESAKQMYEVFLIMRQIHEMLWYLAEALTLDPIWNQYAMDSQHEFYVREFVPQRDDEQFLAAWHRIGTQ